MTTLVWFRRDLRLSDNPALNAAVETGEPIIPVFIWAPEEEAPWQPAAASRWWLHHSLEALSSRLEKIGSRLIVRSGSSLKVLEEIIAEHDVTSVVWNRLYEPAIIERDTRIKKILTDRKISVQSFNAGLLYEPWTVKTGEGKPYQVFTPFWRACTAMPPPSKPINAPKKLPAPSKWPKSQSIKSLDLLPKIKWDKGFYDAWKPGEDGAAKEIKNFSNKLSDYSSARNIPSKIGTSRLSPHLHFGEIGPRQIWHAFHMKSGSEIYLKEIGWREFAHHLLFHFPHTTDKPLRSAFEKFPWEKNKQWLNAWQKGKTGYPIVDAGMRQLWRTGWMHNRVRMIVASFLVKDLRISWLDGAKWFWDTLVDADLANNTLGWQWSAGCGADAAPYFRIFNPATQAEKFDPEKIYINAWAPDSSPPIVDHAEARNAALLAFKKTR